MKPLLLDTGVLYAIADADDDDHPACAAYVSSWRGRLLKYADFPLGSVDASVVAVAERLGLTEVATLDHRHFSAVRPSHVPAFTLLP
ncbi:PIN domain-containing protein [Streptomyces luteolus]|uniref:PIN domain-containing protein n=1 Tax=Streptomyces luteolus TaxID=3043615 RepID=A0ABT6T239_9ACTN|nr:hypothetical protein [Streptomyces sp. B-S-A12]MDI3421937.1 hypothetical protein [Streptomyces sp. B-S-A12]